MRGLRAAPAGHDRRPPAQPAPGGRAHAAARARRARLRRGHRLPDRLTGAQAAEHVLRLLDDREATLVRAKRALIRQRGLTEAQAHRLLQRRAMETGAPVPDAARAALRTLAKEEET